MKIVAVRKILEYLLTICIILEFNTVYFTFPGIKRVVQLMPILILFLLIVISLRRPYGKMNPVLFIYWAGSVLPLLVMSEQNYVPYIVRYVIVLPLLWIYLNLTKRQGTEWYYSIFFAFSNVVIVMAVISILMWLLCSIFQIVSPTAYVLSEWEPSRPFIPTYWGIYFETQYVDLFGEAISRNTGIFNEGPMFNMILCSAFLIEYFIRVKKSRLRLYVLIVAILSTMTTTGQFALIAICLLYFIKKVQKTNLILMSVLIPILIYSAYIVSEGVFENKMQSGGEGSVELRTEDIRWCIEAGLENPILGTGLVTREGENLWNGKQLGRSNSIFAVFARGGLHALTLYVCSLLLIPYLYYRKNGDSKWLQTMLIFFMVFSITSGFMKYLNFLFIAWGLSNMNLVSVKKYNRMIK